MSGRKRLPLAIHLTQGTFRKSRHASAAATSGAVKDQGAPSCPDALSIAAKAAWGELVPLLAARRVLTVTDSAALEVLAETLAEWRQLTADVIAEGMVYECRTEAGAVMKRPNPKVAMRADAHRRLNICFGEFGLTPSSRGKIPSLDGALKENPFARLGKA